MPRPALGRIPINVRVPYKLYQSIRSDAIEKGYKSFHGKTLRIDWQGYIGALFSLVVSEKIQVPQKRG